MKEWFLTLKGDAFVTFGTSHFIMLAIYFIIVFLLLYFQGTIRSNKRISNSIRWILFILLIASEVSYQTWTATHGIWRENLPFHLCGVAGIVGAIALLTMNRHLIPIAFFIGLVPAFAALITPDLLFDFPNFRFFKFFIHHIAISVTSIYLAIVMKPPFITFKSLLYTYFYLVLYAFFIGLLINPWLDANYLYLEGTPVTSSPLDLLGEGFWYRINLGILAFVVFLAQFYIYRFLKRKMN
ncbi:YwaF family protein [Oceanobacillus sp. CAU 1775]